MKRNEGRTEGWSRKQTAKQEKKREGRTPDTHRSAEKRRRLERLWNCCITAGALLILAVGFCSGRAVYEKQQLVMAFAEGESERSLSLSERKELMNATGPENMAETETETETETESESLADGEAEMQNESGAESDLEQERGSTADGEAEMQNESEAESETKSESEAATEGETRPESELIAESEAESGSEAVTESEVESGSEAITESETKPESEPATEGETRPESESVAEGETKPESEAVTEGETKPESEADTESEAESGSEADTESEAESGSEAVTESETKLESEADTESEAEPGSEAVTESEAEPGSETVTESEAESESESATEIELLPEMVYRGRQYEIRGDDHAWYRDSKDRLWVRAGSSLYIETKAESGYGRGASKKNLLEDGTLTFCLQRLDENGAVAAESAVVQEAYYVDGEAPPAEITVSGVELDGKIYAAQAAEAAIAVAPDGKSGLKSAAYAVLECQEDGSVSGQPEKAVWNDCSSGGQVAIREEGLYQVYVRTEDRVGNLAFSKSSVICVDRTPPQIRIDGVGDETANAGNVAVKISCSDTHYKTGSMSVSLSGKNTGKTPSVNRREEEVQGASVEYFDIPHQKAYDDVYQLCVRAEDVSGNAAEQTIDFSVNRFGSVYDLSAETRKNLQRYYLSEAEDVVFYETNIDYVGESDIFCRRDGTLQELTRGRDYLVTMQGSRDSWKRYQYTIPAEYFEKEGVYELLLSSRDRANNESDTGMQEKRVAFVLDWTAPTCVVTGVKARTVYETETTACIVPQDNVGLKTVRLYHDSELLREEKKENGEVIKVQMQPGEAWQTLQVYLQDFSGNEYWSEEIPVFVGKKAEEAPAYRKNRKSAREIEEEKRSVKAGNGENQKTAEEIEAAAEALYDSWDRQSQEPQAERVSSVSEAKQSPGKRRDGLLLLAFGVFMCLATAAAGLMTGAHRWRKNAEE